MIRMAAAVVEASQASTLIALASLLNTSNWQRYRGRALTSHASSICGRLCISRGLMINASQPDMIRGSIGGRNDMKPLKKTPLLGAAFTCHASLILITVFALIRFE